MGKRGPKPQLGHRDRIRVGLRVQTAINNAIREQAESKLRKRLGVQFAEHQYALAAGARADLSQLRARQRLISQPLRHRQSKGVAAEAVRQVATETGLTERYVRRCLSEFRKFSAEEVRKFRALEAAEQPNTRQVEIVAELTAYLKRTDEPRQRTGGNRNFARRFGPLIQR